MKRIRGIAVFMRKITVIFMLSLICSLLFTGCKEKNKKLEGDDNAKVIIGNYNRITEYKKIPERVIVLSYDTAEIMAALGLTDKIIALAPSENSINDVLPQYVNAISKIPVFDKLNYGAMGVPSLESMLAKNPDFVYGVSYSFTDKNVGKITDYEKNGINVYVTEGTYVENPSLQNTYNDIINIAKIFHVEDIGNNLVQDMKLKIAEINGKVKNRKPLKVFVYDSGEDSAYTTGAKSIETELIGLAGGQNIFGDIAEGFPSVSWENVIHKNPDVIIVNKWNEGDDADAKIDYLKKKTELAEVDAVKNDRFIIVSLMSVFPSLQNTHSLQIISEGLHPEVF